jgi:hypothetical protein
MGIIAEATGSSLISVNDSVIGQFRVIGTKAGCVHPESVVVVGDQIYWYNHRKGEFMRYASNAPFNIAEKGRRNFFLQSMNKLYPNSRVITAHNYRYKEIIVTIILDDGGDPVPYTYTYNYDMDVWTQQHRFYPYIYGQTTHGVLSYAYSDALEAVGVFEHDQDPTIQNSYYGNPPVEMVFDVVANTVPLEEKTWESIGMEWSIPDATAPDNPWFSPVVETLWSNLSKQNSMLYAGNFVIKNNEYRAAFLRALTADPDSIVNGEKLKGRWIRVRLQNNTPQDVRLFAVSAYLIGSPRSAT